MQRRRHQGLSTAGGAGQGLEPAPSLASDSEDDELPWRPALGDTISPRIVPESDPEEPDVCPDVQGPRKRRHTPASEQHPDVAIPCSDPDVRRSKKCRYSPKTTTDPDVGRKMAISNVRCRNHSLNPKKVADPDVKHLEGSNPTLDIESDTDVKVPPKTALFHPNCHPTALEVSNNPDVEEGVKNPDVGGAKNGFGMLVVDSDTDVEEVEVLPDVVCPKIRRMDKKTLSVEMETPNPDVGGPKNGCWTLVESNTDVEMESSNSVEGPKNRHQMLTVDSDTDVEENGANPDIGCPQTHQTTQNVPKTRNTEMETHSADIEGSQKGHQMLTVDSDTDVEENGANSDVGYPKAHQTTQNLPKIPIIEMQNADVEGSQKGHGMLTVDSDTDVEENGANPDVGYPKTHRTTQNLPKIPIIEMQNADVEGSQKGHGMLTVDSDTDVEEDTSNRDVHPESHRTAPRDPDVKTETTNRDVEGQQILLVESDTDVEDDTSNPDVGTSKTHQVTQNVPRSPDVETKSPNPRAEGPQNQHWTLAVDSDTDVEENEVNPSVECPKTHRITPKTCRDPDVEMRNPNPHAEELPNEHRNLEVDSDTDVDDDNLSQAVFCPKSHKTPQNTRKDPTVVMETPNPDVGGLSHGSVAPNGDSDTDVEDLNALPNIGAPKTHGITHEVMETVAKMAAAPDVDPERPTRTSDDPDVKMSFPAPDVGAPKARCPVLNVDSDTDVEDNGIIPDVGTVQGCQGASGDPDVVMTSPNPDVSSTMRPGDGSDTDMEEVAPTPDVRSRIQTRIRTRNRSHPETEDPTVGSNTAVEETDPNQQKSSPNRQSLSPKPHGAASVGGVVSKHHVSAPNTDEKPPNPDVGVQQDNGETLVRGEDPVVQPDVSTPKSPHPSANLDVTGGADGGPSSTEAISGGDTGGDASAMVTESDIDEDPDLFLEPTQSFLPPVPEGAAPDWDPEEPTQPFFLPEEEEQPPLAPPQDPPGPWVPPMMTVTPVTPGREGPRRSQRLARSRGGGATEGGASGRGGATEGGASGRGGASRVRGGAPPVPAPVRRSPRLRTRPTPPEPPTVKGQVVPRPPPKPRPHRAGHAPSKRQAQEEEEPPEVVGPQLRPRGGPSSTPLKVLFTGVVASPGMEVALKTLGGSMATSVFDCTHLVTDRVRRTVKFLCAVARGIPIVTPEWLHESTRSGRVLAPGPFLVRDSQQERHFGFSLAQALRRARRHPLLQGYEVHVTPNVHPEPEHMRDIVTCSGGTFLPTMPHTYGPRRLVISCQADAGCWAPALGARLPLASAELLLTGLLRQQLQLQPFLLLPSATPPATPPNSPGTPPTPPGLSLRHPREDSREAPGNPGSCRGLAELPGRGRSRQRHPRDPPGDPSRDPPRDPPGTRRRPAAPPAR
ncbi:mediator of DNA damage checkpoint protein 1 isoform X2 [Balearica regulorum gibbericeps]|uniref:mediator of DNA damage checkpoint protein 1 isoform X2 n=1 Tax=Balearica regulorum gibbericeps TaxID=100784 RepID=UPI003F605FCE